MSSVTKYLELYLAGAHPQLLAAQQTDTYMSASSSLRFVSAENDVPRWRSSSSLILKGEKNEAESQLSAAEFYVTPIKPVCNEKCHILFIVGKKYLGYANKTKTCKQTLSLWRFLWGMSGYFYFLLVYCWNVLFL